MGHQVESKTQKAIAAFSIEKFKTRHEELNSSSPGGKVTLRT